VIGAALSHASSSSRPSSLIAPAGRRDALACFRPSIGGSSAPSLAAAAQKNKNPRSAQSLNDI
jgi:hypothetical protein